MVAMVLRLAGLVGFSSSPSTSAFSSASSDMLEGTLIALIATALRKETTFPIRSSTLWYGRMMQMPMTYSFTMQTWFLLGLRVLALPCSVSSRRNVGTLRCIMIVSLTTGTLTTTTFIILFGVIVSSACGCRCHSAIVVPSCTLSWQPA